MKNFRIIIKDSNVFQCDELFSNGQARYVDMIIYIKVGKLFFPCKDWTDTITSVLFQWIENVLRNRGRSGVCYDMFFMDGPYKMSISQNKSEISLQGICFRSNNEVVFRLDCTYKELVFELLSAVKCLNTIFKQNPLFDNRFKNIIDSSTYYEHLLKSTLDSL